MSHRRAAVPPTDGRPAMPRRVRLVGVPLVAATVLAACSTGTEDPPPDTPSPAPADDGEAAPPEPEEPTDPDEPEAPDEREEPTEPPPEPALGAHGVSAGDPAAVDAGMRILDAGGTAVDAAVAAAFAVAVAEPFASGIGGGGAALVVDVAGEAASYDYREVVAEDGRVPASDTGIPGFVAGMAALHEDHGELPWDEVLAPAIELAEDGVPTSQIVADQLRTGAARLQTGQLDAFYPGGAALGPGDPLVQPDLAATMRTLADDGASAFYEGALATTLADEVDGIDAGSLAAYEVQRTDPPRGPFADLTVVAAAPPLPGAALIQQLQVAEALGIADAPPGSADHVDRAMAAWRVADGTVSSDLGDPDFVDVPVDEVTDPATNGAIAADLGGDPSAAGDVRAGVLSAPVGGDPSGAAGNTTHLTVVDEDGTVVSMTNTLTNFWGSGQEVAGFFLNDQLSRFSIGGDANRPEAGRRSVSWSLPVVVLDEQDRPVLGLGSPGGRRIPNIEAGVLVRWGLLGETLEAAVEAPRVHLEGGVLQVEELPDESTVSELQGRGYAGPEVPAPVYYFGSVQALEIDHDAGTVTGAVDPRRAGDWASG